MFLSTYASVYIGLSPTLVDLIRKHSRQSSTYESSPILPITLLPENQVNQALSHPQNRSLKDLIATGYRDQREIQHDINAASEDLENHRLFVEESLTTLQAKLKGKVSPAFKANIESTKTALNQQLKVMQSIEKEIGQAQAQLTGVTLDQQAKAHDQEWSAYREKYLPLLEQQINKVLEESGNHTLPPGEVDNLLRDEMQEVLDRYIDLGASKDFSAAEMEKLLQLEHPDATTYFKLKAYMALRSVNPPLDQRAKLLSSLDPIFKEAKKEAKKIDDKQLAANHTLDQSIKPILKTVKNDRMELKKLIQDSSAILSHVASIEDLETIREKMAQRTERLETSRPHL